MMSLQSQGRFRDSGAEIPWRDADQLPSSELQLSELWVDDTNINQDECSFGR
jgi:hypothetical protein